MKNENKVEYDPIVRIEWVANYLSVNKSTIWRWRKRFSSHFPQPLQLGKSSVGWRKSAIEKWLDDCELLGEE